jgi:nitroreductase
MNDTLLTIASKRDHRDFDPTALDDGLVSTILDAGRLAGSARNLQPWRFGVAREPDARARLARAVYVPGLVLSAPLVVVLIVETRFSALALLDAGRAAQNMMLAAWSEGVASCPNGVAHTEALPTGLTGPTEVVPLIISFGRPRAPRDPRRRSFAHWSTRARRRPLAETVLKIEN